MDKFLGMTLKAENSILQYMKHIFLSVTKHSSNYTTLPYIEIHRYSTYGWPQPSKKEHHYGGAV
jgi:hypothetical protein